MSRTPPKRPPNPPTKLGRAIFTMPLDAAASPEEAAKRQRKARSRRDECVCQPWPCTPLTGCAAGCRPCAKWGPFYSREDVRFLEGNPAPPASTHQEAS